jgi:integrase
MTVPRLAFTDDALRRLLRVADPSFRRVLLFLSATGARSGEVAELRWADIVLQPLTVDQLGWHEPLARRLRCLDLALRLVRWLNRQPCTGPGYPFVFLNERGRPWTVAALGRRLRRYAARAGLPRGLHLYGLRDRFVWRQAVSGGGKCEAG